VQAGLATQQMAAAQVVALLVVQHLWMLAGMWSWLTLRVSSLMRAVAAQPRSHLLLALALCRCSHKCSSRRLALLLLHNHHKQQQQQPLECHLAPQPSLLWVR
jgi:hypothetical protein